MYFVSNKSKIKFVVRNDDTENKFDNNGKPHPIVHDKGLVIQFLPDRGLPAEFRDHAVAYFNNPGYQNPWVPIGLAGVAPASGDGVTGVGNTQDGYYQGEFYDADDPKFRIGILDTALPAHVLPENREEVEAFLLLTDMEERKKWGFTSANPGLGTIYINYNTSIPLPWPAYAKLKTQPEDIAKLLQRIEDLTEDGQENVADYVIQFERENDNRTTIINAVVKSLGFENQAEYDAHIEAEKKAHKAAR